MVVAACLSYASIKDVKTRMVSDAVWLVMVAGTLPATLYELYIGSLPPTLLLASAGLCFLAGLAAHLVGLFGGADVAALWAIGLALPTYPGWCAPILGRAQPLLSLTVLNNTLALAAATALYALARNLMYKAKGGLLFEGIEASALSKLAALFTGFKVEASKLSAKSHVFLIEEAREGRRKLRASYLIRACRRASMGVGEGAEVPPQGDVWITPALPLIAYMLAGLGVSLTIGDLLLSVIVQSILSKPL